MKAITLLMLLLLAPTCIKAQTTSPKGEGEGILSSVYVPLLGNGKTVTIDRVPAMLFGGRPNVFANAMLCPVYPASVDASAQKHDINLITRAKIHFTFEREGNAVDYFLLIDLKDFQETADLPALEDILHSLLACIRMQHPLGLLGSVDVKIVGRNDALIKKAFEGHLWVDKRD